MSDRGLTLASDRAARGLFDRAALAVSQADAEAAMAVCRDLAACRADYTLTFRSDGGGQRPNDGTFTGRRIVAKFAGPCAVCRRPVEVGATVLFDPDSRRVAHAGCGGVAR